MLGVLFVLLAPGGGAAEAEALAEQALTDGDRAAALVHYEAALRAAPGTAEKARLRDAYRAAGWAPPPPLRTGERRGVALHVLRERQRVRTKAAERFEREGKLHAALILRRALAEAFDAKTDRGRQERDKFKGLVRKLTEGPSEAERAEVKALVAKKKGPALVAAGRKLLDAGRYRVVVRLCQEILVGAYPQDIQNDALALRRDAEARALARIPPGEKEAARAVLDDPRFDALDLVLSRHFVFVGPRSFVASLTEEERTLLDLAYVFQSDLAAQPLTADGRIVVYYQETFDFGGGLAGGKLIRIGNRAIRRPVAGMLHYHELGHCVFGKGWLHRGFTEGLADFAAGFTLDALGQTADAQRFIVRARDQFVRYYLGRAVRYFRIQPYRPSAGFLFSFLPPGEAPFDWTPLRRAFRRMRDAQMGEWPERDHQIMRYFGYLLAAEYGAAVYDRLAEWGWPVSRADLARVPEEAASRLGDAKRADFLRGRGRPDAAAELYAGVLAADPHGPLAPRARYGLLHAAHARGDADAGARLRRELGIVDRFQVCGPFHARKRTAHVVLPPEVRVDLSARVQFGHESAGWRAAKVRFDGFVDLKGQGYGYPQDACALAVAYVRVETAMRARFWLGSDDGHTLLVNGRLVEKRATSRAFRFDDDFADAPLVAGWNRVLVKVHNGSGGWGFLLRITRPDGRAIPSLEVTDEDREAQLAPPPPPKKGRRVAVVLDDFKAFKKSRWFAPVGKFDVRNGRLRALGTDKLALWNRFVVDPDKPAQGPANLLWLRSEALAAMEDFELELVVAGEGKFGITVDGENEADAQSGHTFVFDRHDGKLRCHWYRYDRLLYLQPGAEVPTAEAYELTLARTGSKWRLHVNGVPLFDGVDAPRLPAFGLGLMTWSPRPEFERLRLLRTVPG